MTEVDADPKALDFCSDKRKSSPDARMKISKSKSKITERDESEKKEKEDKKFIVDTNGIVDRYKVLKLIIVIIKFK
jgi:hypothetical protein